MGYKHASKTFLLRFEDMPGLEVQMRSVSIGKLMDMAALAEDLKAENATAAQADQLLVMFADRLVSWTLEGDDDQPVPATLGGVRSLDADLFMAIFEGWFSGMTQAPKGSPQPSANGAHPEVSLPMETLQASPLS